MPDKETVVVAIRQLTTNWGPQGANWWPPAYTVEKIDHVLRVQAGYMQDDEHRPYYPPEVLSWAYSRERSESAEPFPAVFLHGSQSDAWNALSEDLIALQADLWGAPRPTRADVLRVAANFCNLRDAAGRVVYTPSLSGADRAGVLPAWLEIQRQAGSTHVPFGPFTPGPAYPGAAFDNPDLTDPQDLRAFILDLLNQPSASGKGFIPLLMLDGGGPHPETRWGQWPAWGDALADVQDALAVCPAWEPVVGDWTSKQLSDGLTLAKQAFPKAALCWHGSPTRWVGSSNPVEPDDPWQGGEAPFYMMHGGERIDIALYQTPHGSDLYRPCTCPNWRDPFGHVDACWLNRLEDGVARCGTGYHGWRLLPSVVLFETVAFEFFRGEATSAQARELAALAKARVYDKWDVPFLGGNGVP